MKKVKSYSAHFRIISPENPSQNLKTTETKQPNSTKKTLTKQNQEFINKISASDLKLFLYAKPAKLHAKPAKLYVTEHFFF